MSSALAPNPVFQLAGRAADKLVLATASRGDPKSVVRHQYCPLARDQTAGGAWQQTLEWP